MMTDRVIPPRKARRLLIVGVIAALHIVVLLIWWPKSWPTSYKWVLLPDGLGIYGLIAIALQNLKERPNLLQKEDTGRNG